MHCVKELAGLYIIALWLSLLEAIKTQTAFTAAGKTFWAYPGEVEDEQLTALCSANTQYPYYISSDNLDVGIPFASSTEWSYHFDEEVKDCTSVLVDTFDGINICLTRPWNWNSGGTRYNLRVLTAESSLNYNNAYIRIDTNRMWQNMNLCPGVDYYLLPVFLSNKIMILATSFNAATNKTKVYFHHLDVKSLLTGQIPTGENCNCASPPEAVGFFQIKKDAISIITNNFYAIFNAPDTHLGWDPAVNPRNNIVLTLNPFINTVYINYFMNSEVDYLFDISDWGGHRYWFMGLQTSSRRVMVYWRIPDSIGMLTILPTTNGGLPAVISSTCGDREFFHFVKLRTLTQPWYLIAFKHKWDPTLPDDKQVIEVFVPDDNPAYARPNVNLTVSLRPKGRYNMRVRNYGRYTPIKHINYMINGKTYLLDYINTANLVFSTTSTTSTINNLFYHRQSTGECDFALGYPSNSTALLGTAIESFSHRVVSLCVKDHIFIPRLSSQSSNSAYRASISFKTTPPASMTEKITLSSYVNYQLAAPAYPNYATQEITLNYLKGYFNNIKTSYSIISAPAAEVMKNSYISFNIPWYEVEGGNVSQRLVSPTNLNISFLDNKQHFMTFNRTDLSTASVADSDQIYFVGGGALFEDQNRQIGFAVCNEMGNYQRGTFERSCRQVASMNAAGRTIFAVRDYNTNKMCKSVMFILEDKTTKEKSFYAFYIPENKFILFGTLDNTLDIYDVGCTSKTFNAFGAKRMNFVYNTNKDIVYVIANGTIDVDANNHAIGSYVSQYDSMFVKVGTFLSYMVARLNIYNKVSRIATLEGRFDLQNPYRWFFYQNWGSEDNFYFPGITPDHRICFFPSSFVLYNPDLNNNKIITAYFGYFYSTVLPNSYYTKRIFDLNEFNFTNIRGLYCHRLEVTEAFSVFGERSVVESGFTIKYSIIVTFVVNSTNPHKKVYNIYNTSKVFISVKSTDDGYREIYFDLKEFANSAYYRVQFPDSVLLGYLGSNNYPTGTNIPLKFEAYNTYDAKSYSFSLKYNPLPVITVVPKTDQDYVQYKQLDILQDITTSLSGPIFNINLAPDPNNNVKILSNRVNVLPSVKLTSHSKVLSYPSSVAWDSNYLVETLLLREEQAFYFFYNFTYLGFCNIGSLAVDSFKTVSIQAKFNKIHVVFGSNITFYSLYFVNSTSPGICKGPFKLMCDEATNLTAKEMVFNVTNEYNLIPVMNPAQYYTEYILVIYQSDEASSGTLTNTYYRFSRLEAETTTKFMPREPQEIFPTFINSPNLYYKFCTSIQPNPARDLNRMTLCITTTASKTSTSSGLILINHNTHVAERMYTYFNYSISSIADLAALNSMQCVEMTLTTISCIFTFSQSFGTYRRFFLNRDTTSVGCTDTRKYCFNILPSEMITYPNFVSNLYYSVSHSSNYTVSVAKKKQGSYVLDDFYLTIFKHGLSEQYYGMDTGKYPSVDNVAYGFFGYSPNIYYVRSIHILEKCAYTRYPSSASRSSPRCSHP